MTHSLDFVATGDVGDLVHAVAENRLLINCNKCDHRGNDEEEPQRQSAMPPVSASQKAH